ncbi:39S ribosomal protein L2, mitochondrial [Tetranychus urticae]|uniref:Uncharacterized protein n=1 Tax=Tetranychus urticae TaxID=32264 RepID=T1JQE4_TETUR|nr:39S ribosomal protein L2, mitochondrial [Tetranychus urticae]
MSNRLCSLFSQISLQNVAKIYNVSQPSNCLLNVKTCSPSSLFDHQKRTGATVIFKKNIAYPRRCPVFKSRPGPFKYVWKPNPPKDGEYTHRTLIATKLGGRDPETGRVAINTIGGGVRKFYRWLDHSYLGNEGETVQEKVFSVRYDPWNTALLALVANGGFKRWIIASENMKPGDIITTSRVMPKNPIYAKEGQMWPVGALSPGTLIHRIEIVPGQGARLAIAAGTSGEILRRAGKKIIIRIPNGQEIGIDEWCMASVGRVSNPNHYTVNTACTERRFWKGKRQNKGVKMRKDGYCGRKLRPPKPLRIVDAAQLLPQKKEQLKLRTWHFS